LNEFAPATNEFAPGDKESAGTNRVCAGDMADAVCGFQPARSKSVIEAASH